MTVNEGDYYKRHQAIIVFKSECLTSLPSRQRERRNNAKWPTN